ncbi:heavy metal translocating P-type ATPase [Methylococcus capsulatus]|uniref:heavy metal translocating P-type ATPase n=1 Tax=Methylococcus capsulatus TaxID=414 RepID=UPI001C52E7AE|nr:heavy metal translocating P-type ATPase [Methylococcus capsulatus]QXP88732.1 heavy metal translocating P-type ATPase [Methylococcus capsulatus]UQN11011.1 heavy metal translocating P-type ATPase [Methylococcus capsulatus]
MPPRCQGGTAAAGDETAAVQPTIDYGERFKYPVLALGISVVATPLEWPFAPAVVGIVLARAAFPLWKRTLANLKRTGRPNADLLDSLWVLVHGATGEALAPALAICLTETARVLRDLTAITGERRKPDRVPNRQYWIERKGRRRLVLAKDLQAGDQVILGPGDRVPGDGVVVGGDGLIDGHDLLGGARLVPRGVSDEVYAASLLTQGRLVVEMRRLGAETRMAQLAETIEERSWKETRIGNYMEEIGNRAVLPAIGASALVFAATANLSRAMAPLQLDFAQGIGISAPVPVLASLHHAAQNRILIRSGHALEQLAKVDAVVFDKTGTLTERGVEVGALETSLSSVSEAELLYWAASAGRYVLLPFSAALVSHAETRGVALTASDPLDYSDSGVLAKVDGSEIIVGTFQFLASRGIPVDAGYHRRHDGVILNRSIRYVVRDREVLGAIFFSNALRRESAVTIETLRRMGIACYLLTGDTSKSANAVAYQLGIRPGCTFAEASPEHKVEVLRRLRRKHDAVAYVGDGINDAPAMSRADVAVSFQQATDLARETADVVLLDDGLLGLCYGIETAREAMRLVHRNIVAVTAANIAVVAGGIFFDLSTVGAVVVNNGAALLACLNGMRPLYSGERRDPEIERTTLRDDEGLLGIPWRKRGRAGVDGILGGHSGHAGPA